MPTARELFEKVEADIKVLEQEVAALRRPRDAAQVAFEEAEKALKRDLIRVVEVMTADEACDLLEPRRAYKNTLDTTLAKAHRKLHEAHRDFLESAEKSKIAKAEFQSEAATIAADLSEKRLPLTQARAELHLMLQGKSADCGEKRQHFLLEKWKFDRTILARHVQRNRYGQDGYEPPHFSVALVGRIALMLKSTDWYHNALASYRLAEAELAAAESQVAAIEEMLVSVDVADSQLIADAAIKEETAAKPVEEAEAVAIARKKKVAKRRDALIAAQTALIAFGQSRDWHATHILSKFEATLKKTGAQGFSDVYGSNDGTSVTAVHAVVESSRLVDSAKLALAVADSEYALAAGVLSKMKSQGDLMRRKGWSRSSRSVDDSAINNYMNGSTDFALLDINAFTAIASTFDNMSIPSVDTSSSSTSDWGTSSSSSFDF